MQYMKRSRVDGRRRHFVPICVESVRMHLMGNVGKTRFRQARLQCVFLFIFIFS